MRAEKNREVAAVTRHDMVAWTIPGALGKDEANGSWVWRRTQLGDCWKRELGRRQPSTEEK